MIVLKVKLKLMFKGLHKHEIHAAIGGVAILATAFAGYLYFSMSPGKGLRIHPPDFTGNTGHSNKNSAAESFNQISSGSFLAVFGLNVSPRPLPATFTAAAKEIASEPVLIATPAAIIAAMPLVVDLEKAGYRLRGIVHENGRSAAFIFVPAEKKTVIIREKASGTVRLLEAGLRNVKLQTPEGTGVLTLESAKGSPGTSPSAAGGSSSQSANNQHGSASSSQSKTHGQKPDQPSDFSGASSIADFINQGHFRVTQQRGKFTVEVRQIPDAFKGYDLKKGDRIMGTETADFRRSQDIALNLGAIKDRPPRLKVQRNGKIMMLQAPAPPVKTPETTGATPESPNHNITDKNPGQ